MRFTLALALALGFTTPAAAQLETPLTITKTVPLSNQLADIAAYGGLKESACDPAGNLFTPTSRKSGSAVNSVLRIAPDGRTYTRFSIDSLPQLQNGDIADWVVEAQGDVYALAREVVKYSEAQLALKFGDTFIVHWERGGQLVAQVRLLPEGKHFIPSGLAILDDGSYLVAGYERHGWKIKMSAQIFGGDGALRRQLELGRKAAEGSNDLTAASSRVYQPAALKVDGAIYVLRGSSREQVYVISGSGELIRTVALNRAGLEFDSPHIVGNDLIVHAHPAVPDDSEPGSASFAPNLVTLPVFDLRTGESAEEYYWSEPALALVCYARDKFTFVGQQSQAGSARWSIVYAEPGSRKKKRGPRTTVVARIGEELCAEEGR